VEAWLMRPRIEQELALLRQFYSDLEHVFKESEDWFLLPDFPMLPGWRIGENETSQAPLCFQISAGYPSAQPYGFLLPAGINFQGTAPGNSTASNAPPFSGSWQQFSWQPETWFPTGDVRKGSNLLVWVRSFTIRLREGA
jgi:hypothetical protein